MIHLVTIFENISEYSHNGWKLIETCWNLLVHIASCSRSTIHPTLLYDWIILIFEFHFVPMWVSVYSWTWHCSKLSLIVWWPFQIRSAHPGSLVLNFHFAIRISNRSMIWTIIRSMILYQQFNFFMIYRNCHHMLYKRIKTVWFDKTQLFMINSDEQ